MRIICWKFFKGDIYIDATDQNAAMLTLFRKMNKLKFYKHLSAGERPLYDKAMAGSGPHAQRLLEYRAHIPNQEWYFLNVERAVAA